MGKLKQEWSSTFYEYETEEEVIEFIFEHLDTSDFEDSYIQMGIGNEPNTYIKCSKEDKREALYDFMMSLANKEDKLENK
ncbi:hypothetical protein F140042L4_20320 [Coprococcus phoceensis]